MLMMSAWCTTRSITAVTVVALGKTLLRDILEVAVSLVDEAPLGSSVTGAADLFPMSSQLAIVSAGIGFVVVFLYANLPPPRYSANHGAVKGFL